MGEVFIKGHGRFKTQGDKPTQEELGKIKNFLKSDEYQDAQAQKEADKFVGGNDWRRTALEVLGGVGLAFVPGGQLPLLARAGYFAKPFLTQLAKTAGLSGVGGAGGSVVSETFDPTSDPVKSAINAGTSMAVAELIGGPIAIKSFDILGKALKPKLDKLKLVEEGEKTIAFQKKEILKDTTGKYSDVEKGMAADSFITPGIAYNNYSINVAENVAESSLLGGKSIVKAKEGAQFVAEDYARKIGAFHNKNVIDTIKRVDPNGEEVGDLLLNTIAGKNKEYRNLQKIKYDQVDDQIAKYFDEGKVSGERIFKRGDSAMIDLAPLENTLVKIENDLLGITGPLAPEAKNLSLNIREVIKNANLRGPGKMTYQEAVVMKRQLNGLAGSAFLNTQNKQIYIKAIELLKGSVDDMLKSAAVPKALQRSLREADALTEEGNKLFVNNDLISKILKEHESSGLGANAYKMLVKFDKPQIIGKLNEALDQGITTGLIKPKDKLAIGQGLKAQLFQDIITRSERDAGSFGKMINDGKFKDLVGSIGKKDGKAYDAMKEIYDDVEIESIQKAANALSTAYGSLNKKGRLPGAMLIQLTQGGAIVGAFTGVLSAPSAGILLAPMAMSRLFTSPKFSKFLEKGYQEMTDEALQIYNKTGNVADITVNPMRKTATAWRRVINGLAAEGLITFDQQEKFDRNIDEGLLEYSKDIIKRKNAEEDAVGTDTNLETAPLRRPDPLDEALDSLGPMSSAPAPTPQPQGQAPQAQGSGIASLGNQSGGNQSDQLARMEQVGLPLFRG
tara:strand:+ start:858 stop:3224 length:2367 start_codon:yes stop_codon:yes gene_type:complete